MAEIFTEGGRTPRSDMYKQGTKAALAYRIEAVAIQCSYSPGTAEFDAFFAGAAEGHAVWRLEQGDA